MKAQERQVWYPLSRIQASEFFPSPSTHNLLTFFPSEVVCLCPFVTYIFMKIADYLAENADEDLASVMMTLEDAVKAIAEKVRFADATKAGTKNSYGEEQLALDILSDQIMQEECKQNDLIGLLASEELPEEMKIGDGPYAIAYDPLDGSSLVDVNLAVGTIIGVYKTDKFVGVKGREQLASLIAVYGPRTSIVLTVGKGSHEFVMNSDGEFRLTNENLQVGDGKMFSPGNLRASAEREDYFKLMKHWCKEQYTLRYSGGMVPDINHILLKGKGIFSYPGYGDAPNGKLRLLFECAPIAFLMEQAGGAATDGKIRILEKKVEEVHQRTPIFVGSKTEVKRCEDALG
jgi:fructose-1,6-bisphosphatase